MSILTHHNIYYMFINKHVLLTSTERGPSVPLVGSTSMSCCAPRVIIIVCNLTQKKHYSILTALRLGLADKVKKECASKSRFHCSTLYTLFANVVQCCRYCTYNIYIYIYYMCVWIQLLLRFLIFNLFSIYTFSLIQYDPTIGFFFFFPLFNVVYIDIYKDRL